MTILNRIVALLKGKTFQRVLCVALCVCLCFSVFAKNFTKVEAAVGTVSAGYAALSAYLQAGGIFMVVDTGGAAAASSAVAAAAETAVAAGAVAGHTSASSVASAIAAGTTITPAGAIVLTVAAAALCAGIYAYWRSTLSDVGSQDIVLSDVSLGSLRLSKFVMTNANTKAGYFTSLGSSFDSVGDSVSLGNGYYIELVSIVGGANFKIKKDGQIVRYKTIRYDRFESDYNIVAYNANNGNVLVDAEHPVYVVNSEAYPNELRFIAYYSKVSSYCGSTYYGTLPSSLSLTLEPHRIEGFTGTVTMSSVALSNPSGTVDIAVLDGKQSLTLPDVVPAGTSVEAFPDVVYQELANGSLSVGPPTVTNPPGYDEFDPPLPEQGPVEDPTNPGTDMPYLPGTLPIPWHYVERALAYAASFITLCIVTVNELIPSSVSDVIWAAVVLGILFGLIRRFLG